MRTSPRVTHRQPGVRAAAHLGDRSKATTLSVTTGHDDDMPNDGPTLYRTRGGALLHLPTCLHLIDTDPASLVEVPTEDQADLDTCSSCATELDGNGRRLFASLDDALEALPMPLDNRARCREIAAELDFDSIWIPNVQRYVAIGTGRRVAAYFATGIAYVQPPGQDRWTEPFPNYGGPGAGGGAEHRADRPVEVCPVHRIALPASGICDDCA